MTRNLIRATKVSLALTCAALLGACASTEIVQADDPFYAPVLQTMPLPAAPQDGSLFSPDDSMGLFTDQKAMRVGDIITVVLQERTTSSKQSNVEFVKDSDISISPTAETSLLFGTRPSLGAFGLGTNLIGEREFTGEASADQSNNLSGTVSVTVVGVYPNGTLIIRGEKWVNINQGNEYIRLSGLVRPDDVSPDNIVQSNKIANARISYSGTGQLANSQKVGWLGKFFNSGIWPF
ncbi:MAG: flagellar basal body L-ring protein FlgH [Alteromonadaceae bacterium]|nr:MAG: flagellar basal body L-ring protein FlgH [Alteromonadaceae bacterium]